MDVPEVIMAIKGADDEEEEEEDEKRDSREWIEVSRVSA